MAVKLYHGDIVYTPSADALAVYENSYIAVDSGKVEGIYPIIPEKYKHAECIDYGRQMIIRLFRICMSMVHSMCREALVWIAFCQTG